MTTAIIVIAIVYAELFIAFFFYHFGFHDGRRSVWRQEQDWWKNNQ